MFVRDVVRYLSPSSLTLWRYNKVEWYKRYVLKERFPANEAMECGTLFDHYAKTTLGYEEVRPDVEAIKSRLSFKVKPAFDWWVAQGGLADCTGSGMILESTLTGDICDPTGRRVPVLCKPDLYDDLRVVDWKTTGWTASKRPSPPKGYVWDSVVQGPHKDYTVSDGCTVLGAGEEGPWGVQLSTYGILLGREVLEASWFAYGGMGACGAHKMDVVPQHRMARYKYKRDKVYCDKLATWYADCWNADLTQVKMIM